MNARLRTAAAAVALAAGLLLHDTLVTAAAPGAAPGVRAVPSPAALARLETSQTGDTHIVLARWMP